MDDLLSEFLTETAENLETIDQELVRFERDPSDQGTLNNIFRLVHTIKGTCGFLGLPRLEGVAHAGETLLGKFRDGVLAVTPEAVTVVLSAIDRIKEILVGLEETGSEAVGDDRAIIEALQAISEGKAAALAPVAEADPVGPNGEKWDRDLQRFLRPGEVSLADLEAAFQSTAPEAPAPRAAEAIVAPPKSEPARAASPALELEDEETAGRGGRDAASQSIRVNVEVLEQLMDTVSELVLTRNQLLQMVRGLADSEFKAPLQRLSNITADLQDRVMKTRMQPVGSAWRKLPRIVRDICRETGKKIDLRLEGESTELDRQVLELIKDPLTHMIRNSADHGVESPEQRLAAGKPEVGVIRLNAFHEGGHIILLVEDDGAGLNTARIRQKAIDKGLVGAVEAAAMSDGQIHRFIFAPGFSTAAAVTNLSGRGVGMDVVKTNIELIGGSIELQSQEGKGAAFRIQIPLTLAIVSALILGARGQRFAAPQTSVLELVRVGQGAEHRIDRINQTPVLRLRDRLLPLIDLGAALGLGPADEASKTRYVVVMQVGPTRFGAIVDNVHDTEEIVVKPLATVLRGNSMLSGATILGDGSVVVILDPNGLSQALGAAHAESADDLAATSARLGATDEQAFILFRAGGDGIKAAPLMAVTRLEEAPVSDLERADGRVVLQYRGDLMPVSHVGGDHCFRMEGRQPILVFAHGARPIGLAVDEIVDIVHERVALNLVADRPGVIGAAIVRGRATEFLDLGHYLQMAEGEWTEAPRENARKRRVLLVEPSAFSRTLLTPLLQAAGYEIATSASAEEAWRLHDKGVAFDAILADVDADPAAAKELAARIADNSRWQDVARIALSGRGGNVAQFDDCVRKADRAQLLAALEYAISSRGDQTEEAAA